MKSVKHFKLNWKDLPVHDGDFWRIEMCSIQRKRYLLIVHEGTLSTNLLRAIDFHSFQAVADFIVELNPWYRYNGISVGKNENRKVTGAINDMKRTIPYYQDREDYLAIEKRFNQTPWSALPSLRVDKEIERYVAMRSNNTKGQSS